MQSSNPILSRYEPKKGAAAATASGNATPPSTFDTVVAGGGARITINDVIIKCGLLFIVTVVFAVVGWNLAASAPWIIFVGLIGGFGTKFFLEEIADLPARQVHGGKDEMEGGFFAKLNDIFAEIRLEDAEAMLLEGVVEMDLLAGHRLRFDD